MRRKKFTVEQIIIHLREVEVMCSQQKTIGEAVRQIDICDYQNKKIYMNRKSPEPQIEAELLSTV
ncbi:MAG: hypothetical protein GX660_00535 [Clostridiaceae bacterium]|nr:hypothetical protein [Clostridiaceae bacterium]